MIAPRRLLPEQEITMSSDKKPSLPEKVMGPASYFPSIEKKYGRPIAEWKDLIRGKRQASSTWSW
jgi:hypothetical protein